VDNYYKSGMNFEIYLLTVITETFAANSFANASSDASLRKSTKSRGLDKYRSFDDGVASKPPEAMSPPMA
jgi:hypothetical protein